MGIPGTNPDNSVPVLCWMRKDWLDKLGINPDPDGDLCITLDDIAAVAKAFVDANVSGGNHTVGMAFSGNDIADAMCIANAMGGYIDRWIENPDGTMSWSTLAPEVKAAWAKMNEWYEEGILDPQFGTRTTEDINAMMINNELGIVFGAWHIPDWRLSSVKALVPEAEYIAYTVADDNGIVHTYHENAADRFLVVSKDCKYPQVAVEILNILYDDLARATAETAPDVIAYINAGGHNEGRPYYMEVLPSNNPSIYYTEHMAVINGEMTPEETTIAENRGSSQAILDYLKDPQNVTEKTLGGWHFYESRIIGLGASIEALEKNGNAEWITPKYPPPPHQRAEKGNPRQDRAGGLCGNRDRRTAHRLFRYLCQRMEASGRRRNRPGSPGILCTVIKGVEPDEKSGQKEPRKPGLSTVLPRHDAPWFHLPDSVQLCSDVRCHHGLSGLQTRQRVFRF